MGFLDKLKPQPRWKHADAAIRLEAVKDLDDQVELALLAEQDTDGRVRRAAVAKATEVDVLGRVATADADEEIRDRAADRLLAMATANGDDPARALSAAQALTDTRRLSTLAKSEAAESVCAAALARTTDDRALSSIARNAKREVVALAALGRLTNTDGLLEVALQSDHRDVALGAFDRLVASPAAPDLALLRNIESKSGQKAVSKRARARIQELEDAEAARRAAEEEHRRQQLALCESIERLSTLAADVNLLRAELARLSDAWATFGATDAAVLDRFASGVTDAQATITRRERETEEAAERARLRAEAIATRDALCTRVETLDGDDVPDQLVPIEEEWRSLLPLIGNGPEADRLAERFAQAVAACRKRHEMRAVAVETGSKLAGLVAEAEGLLSQDDQAAAAARWSALSRDARGLASLLADAGRPADDLVARLTAVDEGFVARDTARRDAAAKIQQDLAAKLQRLCDRAKRTAEADTITLREGDRLMRDIGVGLDEAARAEGSREIGEVTVRLRGLQEQVAPRVRELRDMDEWRRFANAQRQEQLIAMAEAIVSSLKADVEAGKDSDLAATARALRELHTKWQEVAEAPRQSAQRLWDRFRLATDFIRDRCEKYFKEMRAERGANLQKKTALVEEAEALVQSSDWGKATARLQAMQTEWQAVGPIPRDAATDLSHRFRAACNAFFTRRREDLTDRKKMWAENLARKEALCARAEVLVESTEWDAAAAEMKRLQADWKTVGPVRRNKSEVIWTRFRAAADAFFERFHNRHQITMATKLAEREALVIELEGVAAAEGEAEGLLERLQTIRTTWNRGVPIPAAEMKPLVDRWQTAFAQVIERSPATFRNTEFDPALVIQRMEKLIAKVEALLADVREPAVGRSQAEILAAKLRSALATNAMGGRASEDTKWRAAADAVRDAQTSWQRLTPLSGTDTQGLEARFREACRRVNDQARRAGHTSQSSPARRPSNQTAAAM